jgi:hypothetical protein
MALQMNIPLQGGMTHNDGYIRVTNASVFRNDNTDWFLMVDVSAYKDADERAKTAPEVIPCPGMQKHKFDYELGDESGTNLVALAYAKLKTLSDIYGSATDV